MLDYPGLKAAGKGEPKGSKKQAPAGKKTPKKAATRRTSTRRAAGTRGPGRPRKTAPAVVQQPQDDASAVA